MHWNLVQTWFTKKVGCYIVFIGRRGRGGEDRRPESRSPSSAIVAASQPPWEAAAATRELVGPAAEKATADRAKWAAPCFALSLSQPPVGARSRSKSFPFSRLAPSYFSIAAKAPAEASIGTAHPPLLQAAGDADELRDLLFLSRWLARWCACSWSGAGPHLGPGGWQRGGRLGRPLAQAAIGKSEHGARCSFSRCFDVFLPDQVT
jgi:hypothetical protein